LKTKVWPMAITSATILLLPGLLCDGSMWQIQRAALNKIATTLVADFSPHDDITQMAESVLGMADGPIVAIGHSMGGRVALEVARMAPSRVAGLGLLDTGIHPRSAGEAARRQAMIDLAYQSGMAALADVWLPPMVDPRRANDPALLGPLREMVRRATPDQHIRQIKALLNRPDARIDLPRITCPTLVMVGRQDQWSPLSQHEEIAGLIPNSRLIVIEDCGHMSLSEQPEATTAILADFAATVLGGR